MTPNVKDIRISIEQLLTEEVPENKPQNDLHSEKNHKKVNDRSLIKNVNNQVLIDYLSPEISSNEKSKRIHKYILIVLLALFLIGQFVVVFKLSNKTLTYATSGNADIEIVNSSFTFVSAYITSVVIELIAILNYIIHNVFDSSITELVKIFRETDNVKTD